MSASKSTTVPAPGKEDEPKPQNPDSLSSRSNKNIPRKQVHIKPPLADVSMGRFLTYMVGGLVLLAAFYTWRFTVWAAEVGGYWNLVTGHRNPPSTGPGEAALKAAGKAATAYQSSKTSKSTYASGTAKAGKGVSGGDTDIESQIFKLASALGVKPADLNNAIRPLVDPTAPNPAEAAKIEAEILKAKLAGGGAAIPEQGEKQEEGVGLLSALGEAFLD